MAGIDAEVIGYVVAVVPVRGRLKRRNPYCVDSKCMQVIQPPGEPVEIPHTVPVDVHERLEVEAIDHRILIPQVLDHPCARRS